MKKINNLGSKHLRKRAEEQLKGKSPQIILPSSEADVLKLIHELEVHQIELEMQNDELALAKNEAEIATAKYLELYDFAPAGYFTLSKDGKIIEVNLSGAAMLKKVRSQLINSQFGFFISDDTKQTFNLFLEKVFSSKAKESCEVKIIANCDISTYALLTGVTTENGEHCLLTAVDITQRKQIELELLKSEQTLTSIYDTTGDAIFHLAVEAEGVYRFTTINRAFCNVTGLSVEQVVGKLVNEVIPQPALNIVLGLYKQAVSEKRIIRWEEASEYPTGLLTGLVSVTPIFDENGRCINLVGSVHDITQRKITEDKLQESERFLKETQIIAKLGTYTLDIATGRWKSSEILDTIFGIDSNFDRSVEGWTSIIHPEWQEIMSDYFFYDVIGKKSNFDKEYKIIRQNDKEERWVHGVGGLKYDNNNQPIAMVGTIRDITKRKLGQEAIRESQSLYHDLVETSQDLIWQCDSESRYTYLNPAWEQTFGYKLDEMLGRKFTDFQSPERAAIDLIEFSRLMQGNMVKGFETIHKGKNGNNIHLVFNAKYITDVNNKITGIRGSAYDITKQKKTEDYLRESEEKYRLLVTNIKDVIYSVDVETKEYSYLSPAFEKITGYSLEDIKKMGGRISFLKKTITKAKFIEWENYRIELSDEQLDSEYTQEEWWLCKDGSYKCLRDHWIPIFENGKLVSTYGVLTDYTKRRLAEEKLKVNESILKKINADKDLFISILAHDLKNPFNSMLGFLELLAENYREYDNEKIETQLGVINSSAKRIYNLLESILMWVRSQSGKIPYEPQNVCFTTICNEVLSDLELSAEAKNLAINHFAKDKVDVFADIDMLKTVLRNLVSNAIKFSYPGGKIDICAESADSKLIVSVSDNGIGITPERIGTLFDITQVQSTKGTLNEYGTGLGLLLCKEFIEKHGGRIWVESEMGKYSKFNFSIPL
ncbi:MAG: PAS domain-containing sensor histidine kinase [Bacteroidales bacterium]|nr:PAS domain-containing sensor histidine kinase [Bacteroidales bacterium]